MPELKIGIQLSSLRMPFKKALHIAGELGAAAVEIDGRNMLRPRELTGSALRHVRKMLEDRNLRVCAVGFRTRRGYDVLEDLDRRVEATKEAMKMAYDLGASVVVNQVGRIPENSDDPAWDQLVQVLADLGNYGQRVGALLGVETGTEEGETISRLLTALPTGGIGVNFDPGNLLVNGFSPSAAIAVLAQSVIHVHARDGVRDLARGRGLETPLGRGSVDFPELIGSLEEHGYRGYFTIEREQASDPQTEIGLAVQYLRNL